MKTARYKLSIAKSDISVLTCRVRVDWLLARLNLKRDVLTRLPDEGCLGDTRSGELQVSMYLRNNQPQFITFSSLPEILMLGAKI